MGDKLYVEAPLPRKTAGAIAVAAACLLTTAGTALGQRALGDGRALERDLAVYGTGLKGRDVTQTFKYARNVALGRVGGGFSFMGDLGYSDPSDITATLGSNDLRDFRNRSQGSELSAIGNRAGSGAEYQSALAAGLNRSSGFRGSILAPRGLNSDVNRDFFNGGRSTRGGGLDRSPYGSSDSGLSTDPLGDMERNRRRSAGLGGGASRMSFNDAFGSTALSAGSRINADLGADTLNGVTQRSLSRSQDRGGGVGIRGLPQLGAPKGFGNSSLDDAERRNQETEKLVRDSDKSRSASAGPSRADNAAQTRTKAGREAAAKQDLAVPLASPYEDLKNRMSGLNAAGFGKPGTEQGATPKTPDLTPGITPRTPGGAGAPTGPGSPGAAGDQRPTESGLKPAIQGIQQGPASGQDVESRLESLRQSLGIDPRLMKRETDNLAGGADWLDRKAPDRPSWEQVAVYGGLKSSRSPGGANNNAKEDSRTLDPQTIEMIKNSGGTMESFLPAGATGRDPYAEHIAAGQRALAAGQYMTAEERFGRAGSIRRGDISAAVGRLHGQIGGGMVLSAGATLRAMLTVHPEIAGVHYAPALLPPRDRLEDMKIRLRDNLATGGKLERESALVLAYVGFQTGDTAAVAEGLDRLDKAADSTEAGRADRSLVTFLRRLWAEPASTAAPSEPGAK